MGLAAMEYRIATVVRYKSQNDEKSACLTAVGKSSHYEWHEGVNDAGTTADGAYFKDISMQ